MFAREITISREQARRFLLLHQGLTESPCFEGKSGITEYIKRVGCIQFDPLNIVGHNQELVLQSRIRGFRREMLQELLYSERKLVDAWDKNMSIYSVEDWPFFERNRRAAKDRFGNSDRPAAAILGDVRKEFEERGPLSSGDIDYNQTVDWAWAPTRLSRAVLESMYFWGELIIHHKIKTRKVYDLANRHIPKRILETPDPNKTSRQYYAWYVLRRIGSIGLLWNKPSDAWLGIEGLKSAERSSSFESLNKKGLILKASVEGVREPLYIRKEDRERLNQAIAGVDTGSRAAVLAPLDNMMWDRNLIRELFGFEYRWEVYKPVSERRYGYYVLPVLFRDRFVARFEPGMDKKKDSLIIKNWWWEPGVVVTDEMKAALSICFKEFMEYLGAGRLEAGDNITGIYGMEWLPA